MPDDVPVGERLMAIEVLMVERKEQYNQDRIEWRKKLDKLIDNSKGYATNDTVIKAVTTHAETCPWRTAPIDPGVNRIEKTEATNPSVQLLKASWKELGALGGAYGIMFGLLIIILKLIGVL